MVKGKGLYSSIFVLSLLLTSCFESNEIYFELTKNSVMSCNRKGIRQLYITNDSTIETFSFFYSDSASEDAPKIIKIDSISEGYCISKGWKKLNINRSKFKLNALSQYTIERVQGDASAYKIKVWTDEYGKITKTSKGSCN